MIKQHQAHNLTFNIVQDLGQQIVLGKYDDCSPFPTEAMLCADFDVSRSVMREAIKMLSAKGILYSRPRRGIVVNDEKNWSLLDKDVLRWLLKREVSLPLLIEFTQIRLGIEPMAASLAANNITKEQQSKLISAIKSMERADSGESDPLESDIAFHLAVIEASNNRFITQLDDLVETTLRFSIRLSNRFKGVSIASVRDHRMVADAILAGDARTAKDGMEKMLLEALNLFCSANETELLQNKN